MLTIHVLRMKIFSSNPNLGFILKESAPEGVVVDFDPPVICRSAEITPAEFVIALKFALDVDVKTVAMWLLSESKQKIKSIKTESNLSVNIDLREMELAISMEKKTTKKYYKD